MVIMDYADEGNLRECLTKIIGYNWKQKLHLLYLIIFGLHKIHQQNLIHCDCERPKIIENTPQCYTDLMKRCWNEDPLKRPSASEVLDIIAGWIILPFEMKIDEIDKELKCNIMEFINAKIGCNKLITKTHSQVCYTSRLISFASEKLDEFLESKCLIV
ncbi:hypothetical protein C1646_804433 [Rhizophagus diaphanus]|nr:hypothetical protein C1646_804433 [Rhizophagus diaphanus] [Rhizophagus sp. MUCL 43196]